MKFGVTWLLLSIFIFFDETKCSGIAVVTFKSYSNFNSQKNDGTCCHVPSKRNNNNNICKKKCSNVFYVCLSDVEGRPPCDMVQLKSFTISSDNITFPVNEEDKRLAYPFNYTFYKWSKKIEVDVTVVNEEPISMDALKSNSTDVFHTNLTEVVVAHFKDMKNIIANNFANTSLQTLSFLSGNKTLVLEMSVTCDEGFLPPDCEHKICNPVDNDTEGHYNCSKIGIKVCLPGWSNATVNCTVPTCKYDDNERRYVCLQNGEKQCIDGWVRPDLNCSVKLCTPMNDSQGHFDCTELGDKICLAGWDKPDFNCTVKFCQPMDSKHGHYECSELAEKVCLKGWSKPELNCTVHFCVPQDGPLGHFECSDLGEKICLLGWENKEMNCRIKTCFPKNDEDGHYNCSDIGDKFCLDGWSNEKFNCTIKFCQPQNSTEKGHYTCSEKGEIVCMVGWTDPEVNCTKENRIYHYKNLPHTNHHHHPIHRQKPYSGLHYLYLLLIIPVIGIILTVIIIVRRRTFLIEYDQFEDLPMQEQHRDCNEGSNNAMASHQQSCSKDQLSTNTTQLYTEERC